MLRLLVISLVLGQYTVLRVNSDAVGGFMNTYDEALEIDQFIPETITNHCTAVILSDVRTHFRPMTHRPVLFLTQKQAKLVLHYSCNILVIPDYASIQDVLGGFLLVNRNKIVTIMVYSYPSQPITIKQIRIIVRIMDVVLIDLTQNTSKLFKYPLSCHGKLRCIMKNRFLRVGYTSIPPTLRLKNPDWDARKALNKPIEPFELNQTNRVSNHFSGVEAKLLSLLVHRYGMRFQMISPPDFQYGIDVLHNGSFNGKYGMLQRDEVDMIIGLVNTNSERGSLGSYSPPIFVTKFCLGSLRDRSVQNWNAALRPFPQLAWAILGLSIIFVAPVTWFIAKKHRELMKTTHLRNESLGMYFAHAMATLLVEPWPRPPGGPAAIIVGCWFIVSLILQSIYASNFAVSLSFPDVNKPIRTLEDVWEMEKQIMVAPGTSVDWFLSKSNNSIIKKVYQSRYHINHSSLDGMFPHLNMGLLTTIPPGVFYWQLFKEGLDPEDYYVSDIPILTSFGSWLFEANDVLMATEIGKVIVRATSAGLLQKWHMDDIENLRSKARKESEFSQSISLALSQKEMALSLSHLEGVFKFWLVGIGIGILTFIYEFANRPIYNICTARAQKKAEIRMQIPTYSYLD